MIGVGAVTKDTTIVPGFITVTAPPPVPANLESMPFGGAAFGPQATTPSGRRRLMPAESVSTAATNKTPRLLARRATRARSRPAR